MKTITIPITLLFVLHTIEEGISQIWQTDLLSSFLSKILSLSPAAVYWLGQIVLYVILYFAFFSSKSNKKTSQSLRIVVGVLLLLEFSHTFWSYGLESYTPGLYTGTLLGISGLYFWWRIYKNNLLKTI